MKKIITNPFFLTILILKIFIIFYFDIAVLPNKFYIPFLLNSVENFTFDPWKSWLNINGTLSAFPYGYVMWLYFAPFIKLANIFNLNLLLVYKTSLIFSDFFLCFLINRLFIKNINYLLLVYFVSPLSIISIYLLGLNDVLPVLILFISFFFLKENKFYYSGFFLGVAISAKLSMIISIPFFFIFFFNNKNIKKFFKIFFLGFFTSFVILILPFIFSKEAMTMILQNLEVQKVAALNLKIGNQLNISIIPLIYILLIYYTWTIKRINFNLLISNIGLSYLLIILFTESSPGWIIWCLPFFAFYQSSMDKVTVTLISTLSILFSINFFINDNSSYTSVSNILLNYNLYEVSLFNLHSQLQTLYFANGLILILICWKKYILNNEFFRITRKPFCIGIAGDSGVGKDRLSISLSNLIDKDDVTYISGDNYHLWERNEPNWKFITPLNPSANDLERFTKDLIDLIDKKNILTTYYDHNTGKIIKDQRLESNNFIISNGLHAFYTPLLQECCDLKIYLNPEENIKKYFKITRDTIHRNYSRDSVIKIFQKRKLDNYKYIYPQKKNADLIFSLKLKRNFNFKKINEDIISKDLQLEVRTKIFIDNIMLKKLLTEKFSMNFKENFYEDGYSSFVISGNISKKNINYLAKKMCPNILEFLQIDPKWESDLDGIMQLIILLHINKIMNLKIV